jgi:hypothetical protein
MTMFLLSLVMELWGTALGNWAWRSALPGLGWPVANRRWRPAPLLRAGSAEREERAPAPPGDGCLRADG